MIHLLRQHGADPLRTNHYGVSPLSLARTIGNYDVSQFFADL
jgi:ankyrin repeat protein